MIHQKYSCFTAALLCCAFQSAAVDTYSFDYTAGVSLGEDNEATLASLGYRQSITATKWVDGLILSYGVLHDDQVDSQITTIGAYWNLYQNQDWRLELGFAPTYLSSSRLHGRRVGGNWHFTSSLSMFRQIANSDWAVGMIYQHTSNGSTQNINPGVDVVGLVIRNNHAF